MKPSFPRFVKPGAHNFPRAAHTKAKREVVFLQVRDVMNPTVVSIAPPGERSPGRPGCWPGTTWGALPVCSREGTLHGMVTDRDLVLRCVAAEEDPRQVPVRQVMSRHPAQVAPGTTSAKPPSAWP